MTNFHDLQPEAILSAVEKAGFEPTGELIQLNSYENRVFDIALENRDHIIAKFYRPGRWSQNAILDEHLFLNDLKENQIAAIAPSVLPNGQTLENHEGLYFSLFPKVRGRLPDELLEEDLKKMGRLLAQLHNVGAEKKAQYRQNLTVGSLGLWESLDLLQHRIVPELRHRYNTAAASVLEQAEDLLDSHSFIRIHGDCHRGNILDNGQNIFLVDFDDFLNGPRIQDFWMLLSGDADQQEHELDSLAEGYEALREFPWQEVDLIPILRGIRIIHYSSWIEKRWSDPSFPRIFPDYGTYTYWARETEALEKIFRMG